MSRLRGVNSGEILAAVCVYVLLPEDFWGVGCVMSNCAVGNKRKEVVRRLGDFFTTHGYGAFR